MSQTVSYSMDAPQPTLQEAAAAMDAAAAKPPEGSAPASTTPTPSGDRPSWLPENFKSVEDFKKSYDDGRGELTRLQQELAELKKPKAGETPPPAANEGEQPPAAKTPEELAAASATEQAKAAQDALAKTNLDTKAYSDEFAKTGDISAESRAKIADALKGQFGDAAPALVHQFIEGQKASAQALRAQGLAEAGGQEQYAAMAQWAATNLPKGQLDAYNSAVNQSNVDVALLAIRGLRASYEKANGRAPSLVQGDNKAAGNTAMSPFGSARQMTDAINDPRYAKDEAYRAEVAKRIQMSSF